MNHFDDFQITVFDEGYKIENLLTEEGGVKRVIVALGSGGAGRRASEYRPEEDASLCFEFANTDPTEAGVIHFANQYGCLKGSHGEPREILKDGSMAFFEYVEGWLKEVREMRKTLDLWDAVLKKDKKRLSQNINYSSEGYFCSKSFFQDEPLTLVGAESTELIYPACHMVFQILVEASNRHTIKTSFACNVLELKISTWHKPSNLISFLWLQASGLISQNKTYQPCAVCKKHFQIKMPTTSKTRIYCSNACRVAAYRQRKTR